MATARYRPPALRRCATALALACLLLVRLWGVLEAGAAPGALAEGDHTVQQVIDGDTLVLSSGRRVRLQGIDTRESAGGDAPAGPLSADAAAYARGFVLQADNNVRLTFTDERIDHYGRYLAFVWSGERCLNEELVREGLARARLDSRFAGTMRQRLRDAEADARDRRVGLWATAR